MREAESKNGASVKSSRVKGAGVAPRESEMLGRTLRRGVPKTSVVIAVDLATYIIDEDIPDGTLLPNEKEMADELGVGRTSIREALRILETRGILRIRTGPGGGPIVRHPEPSDFSSALEFALQFERATLAEAIRAREDLGPFMARLASARTNERQVGQLRSILDSLNDDLDSYELFARHAARFEALLGEASSSVVVRLMVEAINRILHDTIPHREYTMQRRRSVATSLQHVLDAVAEGDEDEAEARMSAYVRSGARYWRKVHPNLMTRPIRWAG